ncbi:universal stress protein [Microbacterium sp.]|uniref:universal stress protein n=1 Tax=Microbacterium sp. TaxID=51671 RepID=UPI0032220F7F
MTEKIVVALNGAPVSARTVEWALERAIERRQRIELVGIVGGVVGSVGEVGILNDALESTQAMLDAHAERIRTRGVEVATRVDSGNPVSWLVAASESAALLVIGSDYRGPDAGPARGTHGIRIAAGAKCPVVVVPDIDLGERSGVVVGVDGSAVSEHAIRFAAAEADRHGEPLVAVAVWTPVQAPRNSVVAYPEEYLRNLEALTEEALALSLAGLASDYPDLQIVRRAERGFPSDVLTRIAGSARLVVLGSHGRGAIARFLLGSISQEVLARLPTVTAIVR